MIVCRSADRQIADRMAKTLECPGKGGGQSIGCAAARNQAGGIGGAGCIEIGRKRVFTGKARAVGGHGGTRHRAGPVDGVQIGHRIDEGIGIAVDRQALIAR